MLMLLVTFTVLVAYTLWQRRHYYRLSWQLPGPIAVPIVGNGLSLAHSESKLDCQMCKTSRKKTYSNCSTIFSHVLEVLPYLDHITSKYGSPTRLWLGPELLVFISDVENAEIVLKSKDCLNKPNRFYKVIRDGLQVDGLFTLKGKISTVGKNKQFLKNTSLFYYPANEWKTHRRLVSPSMNLASVSAHLPIFNRHIRKTVANLPTTNEFIDILPYLLTCKIEMFAEAAMGSDIESSVMKKYCDRYIE